MSTYTCYACMVAQGCVLHPNDWDRLHDTWEGLPGYPVHYLRDREQRWHREQRGELRQQIRAIYTDALNDLRESVGQPRRDGYTLTGLSIDDSNLIKASGISYGIINPDLDHLISEKYVTRDEAAALTATVVERAFKALVREQHARRIAGR